MRHRRDGRVAEGARLESVFRGNSNVGSNPTLSASFLSTTYENCSLSACNGVQRASNVAWLSTSIDATARNVKAPTLKIPAPDNLKRDGAAGKNALARSTYPARLAGSLAAGRPAPSIGTKRRPLLLCGNSPAHGTARTRLQRRYLFLPQTPNPNGLALTVQLRPLQQSSRNTRPRTPDGTINSS